MPDFFAHYRPKHLLLSGAVALSLGLPIPTISLAQNSLSGAQSSRADTLLRNEVIEPYLQSDYYKQLTNNKDIYGKLPEELQRIFARIRFVALSIDNTAASDQVLNALTRAYLIYDMEAAAVNEAVKIILPEWQARSLIDISDYYGHKGETQKRDRRLQEALDILTETTDIDPIVKRQYFFDIASRMALSGKDETSKKLIHQTFSNPIHRIMGFLQIAERVHLGTPSNALFGEHAQDIMSSIRQCTPEQQFVIPKVSREKTFSLNEETTTKTFSDQARGYVLDSYAAFEKMNAKNRADPAKILDDVHLRILLNLNEILFSYGYQKRAHNVLSTIVDTFLSPQMKRLAKAGKLDHEQNMIPQESLNALRNQMISAFIRSNEIESAMNLTRGLSDPEQLSQAYISAGNAQNSVDNFSAAVALFNYAQDVADLVKDSLKRDRILRNVIRGQSAARLYGSAFHNMSQIVSQEIRSHTIYEIAQQMIINNDLHSSVEMSKYLRSHDLRIQIYANLAYVRSRLEDRKLEGKNLNTPTAQEMFEHIYELMENRIIGGLEHDVEEQPKAVLKAMCADLLRGDIFTTEQSGSPLDGIRRKEYSTMMEEAATDYTSSISDAVMRAQSFSNIAEMKLESGELEETQLFLDTAWNLAWSIRGKAPSETDKIFLRIVRGKIISDQITDAFNIATGMGRHLEETDEIVVDPVTAQVTYSDRIQALMDFSRIAMTLGEYSISLRAIDDIGIGTAKSVAMTKAIRDLIKTEGSFSIDSELE